jgi:SpoVK/Ycf46/Vps4 family AAA+-type ATPase
MYFDVIQVLSSFFVMIRNVNVGGAEERDKLTFAKYQIIDRIRDIKEGLETFDKLSFTHVHPKIKAKTKTAVHPQLIKYVKISHMLSAVSKNPNVAKEKVFDIYTMHRKTRLTHLRSPTETDENPTYYEASQNQMGSIELKALKRPKIKFDDLVGASYNEAKQHIKTMMTYNSYPALFISTSPSKSLKSNILLLGPPGSGKSEIFRSMAGSGKIVVVNVSGASIRSMWYGQSEQNIMLLAKAAEKLHRQTGKIVYVVIDEIDNVLGVPSEGNNLADVDWRLIKTFQEVLDGIRRFDGVVWCGATNNPERLGTAALRRFSFVDAPGELTTDERAQILKNYLTLGLPLAADITDDDFHRYGLLMEGAVGDIVRKVVDDLHEKVFAEFTREHPREAKELETWIKRKEFDVFKLTKRDREFIKRKISRHLVVSKSRLEDLLTAKMSSPDIVREVEEARKTFTRIHDIKSNARERLRPYK